MRDRETERGRDAGRGRSRLRAGSPTRDWIPGPRDHLSQTQTLNHQNTRPCIPGSVTFFLQTNVTKINRPCCSSQPLGLEAPGLQRAQGLKPA